MINFKLTKDKDDIVLLKNDSEVFRAKFSEKEINIETIYYAIGITNKDTVSFDVNGLSVSEAKGEEAAFQKFTVEFIEKLFIEIIKVTNKK
ncbi:MAG: hypothetical protein CVV60_01270 [Tenericutes bacterium HGW-Tenericutes-5]|jgi:hypothetical protein|nr:MAG: hypothetical protein CVV60_01270 [Tenericutes bacterium HGW-Tenericutes-5]